VLLFNKLAAFSRPRRKSNVVPSHVHFSRRGPPKKARPPPGNRKRDGPRGLTHADLEGLSPETNKDSSYGSIETGTQGR
jgi:hypothetical protein